jgi:hypothetical protein
MTEIYSKSKTELSVTKTEVVKYTKQQIMEQLRYFESRRQGILSAITQYNEALAELNEEEALWKEREKQFNLLVENK